MTKLKNFALLNAEILDKKGMKEVTGGSGGEQCLTDVDCLYGPCVNRYCTGGDPNGANFRCQCHDSGFNWIQWYDSASAMANDLNLYCATGGTCTQR